MIEGDDDDTLLAQELAYVPWSKEERARRTRGRWFAPKEHVSPGFHVLQLARARRC